MNISKGIYRVAQLIKWIGRSIGGLFVVSSAYSMMFSKPYETYADAYGMLLMAGIFLAITEGIAWVLVMSKVINKNLWIEQVIHALTVTKGWVIHALTVTISRINSHNTIYSLYLPIVKTPVVGASLFGDNLAGCHPNRLHLPPTAIFKD